MEEYPQQKPSMGSRSKMTCNNPAAAGEFFGKCFMLYGMLQEAGVESISDDVWESLFWQSAMIIGVQ